MRLIDQLARPGEEIGERVLRAQGLKISDGRSANSNGFLNSSTEKATHRSDDRC
jgi:hypothetical protein